LALGARRGKAGPVGGAALDQRGKDNFLTNHLMSAWLHLPH